MIEPIVVDSFAAFTPGVVVYFLGARMTKRYPVFQRYSIPEPVSGGLIAALVHLFIVCISVRAIQYDLAVRDFLLVYFFTTVRLNACIADLVKGGRS
ncbi:sodium/glutamate symporter [Lutimaribacter marinistellae]|uniref:Sodium/glutamate symporter n=1 Tax=Lutimaribacter marinistellae TaxID=1820329 RepID=A0ABV7TK76_9RHOB